MNQNLLIYAEAIDNAKVGNEIAEGLLRRLLQRMSQTMALPLLISLSEQILEDRRAEIIREVERN